MKYGYYYEIREVDPFYRRLEPDIGYSVLRFLRLRGCEPMLVSRRFFESREEAQRYVEEMEKNDDV